MAYLCKTYNWNPRTQIIGHYTLDSSRRTDPINAFSRNGKTWSAFINDVVKEYNALASTVPTFISLREGSRGERVTKLQTDLAALEFYKGKVDGIFGPVTKTAVTNFQRSAKLTANGICDAKTAGALENALRNKQNRDVLQRGDSGDGVRKIQEQLVSLGYNPGTVDSIFGPRTETAVRQFQGKRKISVDGKVSPVTIRELDAALREKISQNPKPTPPVQGPTPKNLYRVQIGAFNDRNNAERLKNEAIKKGLPATIIIEPLD